MEPNRDRTTGLHAGSKPILPHRLERLLVKPVRLSLDDDGITHQTVLVHDEFYDDAPSEPHGSRAVRELGIQLIDDDRMRHIPARREDPTSASAALYRFEHDVSLVWLELVGVNLDIDDGLQL